MSLSAMTAPYRLHGAKRRLAIEAGVAVLAAVLALMVFSSVSRPAGPDEDGARRSGVELKNDSASDAAVRQFAERFALSHFANVARGESPASQPVEPEPLAVNLAIPPHARDLTAPTRGRPHSRSAHLAGAVAEPPSARMVETAVAVDQDPEQDPTPLLGAMRRAAETWQSIPAAGALVIDNVESVGDTLASVARKPM